MVIMSVENYDQTVRQLSMYRDLEISEQQINEGKTEDARSLLNSIREKYAL